MGAVNFLEYVNFVKERVLKGYDECILDPLPRIIFLQPTFAGSYHSSVSVEINVYHALC